MGNHAQIQTQATPPAVLHAAATKPRQRIGTNRGLPLPTASPAKTYGVNTEVFSEATPFRPSPEHCTAEQLFEIVMDVARRFRTAKETVAEHRDYILRLKAEVFKVRFGSFGARVPVKCRPVGSRPHTRRLLWKEFCEEQFGVSADWINRLCSGKAEAAGGATATEKREPEWRTILAELLDALGPCTGSLPLRARDAFYAVQELLEREGDAEGKRSGEPESVERYWLTPPGVYAALDDEFHFDFDACPFPKPEGFDSLAGGWGRSTFVNPPFHTWDGGGRGPTAWVRKAIEEHKKGKQVVLLLPVQSYVDLLLEAGAEVRNAGRVRWLEADTKQPCSSPSPIACFILRPNRTRA